MPYSKKELKNIRTIQALSQTPSGQDLFEFLRVYCRADTRTFVPGDSLLSAYNEGMRAVYLELMRLKNVDEHTLLAQNRPDPYQLEDTA